jgi:hypothetical protein
MYLGATAAVFFQVRADSGCAHIIPNPHANVWLHIFRTAQSLGVPHTAHWLFVQHRLLIWFACVRCPYTHLAGHHAVFIPRHHLIVTGRQAVARSWACQTHMSANPCVSCIGGVSPLQSTASAPSARADPFASARVFLGGGGRRVVVAVWQPPLRQGPSLLVVDPNVLSWIPTDPHCVCMMFNAICSSP